MKTPLLAIAAAALLATAGASAAQPAPGGQQRPGVQGPRADAQPGQRQGPARQGVQRQRMDPAQMAERRAERLRVSLQLRPEQDAALKAFVDATQPKPRGERQMRQPRQGGAGAGAAAQTTPQRLDQARKGMTERQARFDQMASATLRFYNQLSPSQQKAFDAQRGPGRAMRAKMGGHRRMAGPGGRGGPGGWDSGRGGPGPR